MRKFYFVAAIVMAWAWSPSRAQGEIIAYWNFDSNFNATVGGPNFDLSQSGGATAGSSAGRFGNAASFSRAFSQYAFTSGDVLTADADFSYSAWFNTSIEDITGSNRYFVLETTAFDEPSGDSAWTASLGLRDLGSGDIAEFFTNPSRSFATGGYNSGWNNAIVTYDADGGTDSGGLMQAYINGSLIGTYDNVASTTPVSGLVIGGHRSGTGRNFDGLIDDVAFFNSVLSGNQINRLQTMNAMQAVPEPSAVFLLCGGATALLLRRRR